MENNKNVKQVPLMKRVLNVVLKEYKISSILVVMFIIGSALATLQGTLFMRSLVDEYILPLTQTDNPDFGALGKALLTLTAVYAVGILCAYAYNRIMVNISQGTLRRVRIDLFTHMESLPIRYFDTTRHGDIMSVYTNDVDTLRQLISQSIPQTINSAVTILISFISMLALDIPLTLLTLAMVFVMLFAASKISGKASVYFIKQQNDIGRVNAYIEEMMDGQKVVKTFCHEKQSIEDFQNVNEELRKSANQANQLANILMPVNANLSQVSYVLCAVVGAALALSGHWSLTLGTLVSFLNLNRNFTQPVTQISQQINNVIMALAGAERIFSMLDEQPEADEGYVELVNAKEQPDGTLTETPERTGL